MKPFCLLVDCQSAVDSVHCNQFWQPEMCQQFTNVPNECPHMCRLCPLADFRLQGNVTTTTGVTTPITSPTTTVSGSTIVQGGPTSRTTSTQSTNPTTAFVPEINVVHLNSTATENTENGTKVTTGNDDEIEVEQKNGKTLISIPNTKMFNATNDSTRTGQPNSKLYSTLVLILKLL